jgi:hypothetical protein
MREESEEEMGCAERERETESAIANCHFMSDSIIVNEGGEQGRDGTCHH